MKEQQNWGFILGIKQRREWQRNRGGRRKRCQDGFNSAIMDLNRLSMSHWWGTKTRTNAMIRIHRWIFDGVRLRCANAAQSASACVFGRVCETAIVACQCLSVCLRGKKRLLIINLAQLESQLWTRKREKKVKRVHMSTVSASCVRTHLRCSS